MCAVARVVGEVGERRERGMGMRRVRGGIVVIGGGGGEEGGREEEIGLWEVAQAEVGVELGRWSFTETQCCR